MVVFNWSRRPVRFKRSSIGRADLLGIVLEYLCRNPLITTELCRRYPLQAMVLGQTQAVSSYQTHRCLPDRNEIHHRIEAGGVTSSPPGSLCYLIASHGAG